MFTKESDPIWDKSGETSKIGSVFNSPKERNPHQIWKRVHEQLTRYQTLPVCGWIVGKKNIPYGKLKPSLQKNSIREKWDIKKD